MGKCKKENKKAKQKEENLRKSHSEKLCFRLGHIDTDKKVPNIRANQH